MILRRKGPLLNLKMRELLIQLYNGKDEHSHFVLLLNRIKNRNKEQIQSLAHFIFDRSYFPFILVSLFALSCSFAIVFVLRTFPALTICLRNVSVYL
jgi:hypothetical protein